MAGWWFYPSDIFHFLAFQGGSVDSMSHDAMIFVFLSWPGRVFDWPGLDLYRVAHNYLLGFALNEI